MPIFARILDEKYIKTFFMINPIVKTGETGFLTDCITGREALEQSKSLNVLSCLRVLG